MVLADDAGQRAVPAWLQAEPGESDLARLVELRGQPAGEAITAVPEELITRLLGAAGASVTGVNIDVTAPDVGALGPEAAVARVALAGPSGARQVTASLGLGLALAVAADVPVRIPDAVMDKLATPVAGDDLLTPFLGHVPPYARPQSGRAAPGMPVTAVSGKRPRYEPRNMDFGDGLNRWDLEDPEDYTASVDGAAAVLSSAAARPAGGSALVQAIYADDYLGTTVTFGGEIRTYRPTEQAGLLMQIIGKPGSAERAPREHTVAISGGTDWTRHEVTALVPDDADIIRFGVTLTGIGRIALRNPELARTAR